LATEDGLTHLVKTYTNIKQPDQIAEAVALLESAGVASHDDILDPNTDEAVWKATFASVEGTWEQSRKAGNTALRGLQFFSLANLWSKLRANG
jgi:hypothetical protein